MASRVTSTWSYTNIPAVQLEDPPTDEDSEASTQELPLLHSRRPSRVSKSMMAAALLLAVAIVACLTLTTSGYTSSWTFSVKDAEEDTNLILGLAEAANSTDGDNATTEGDIRIRVCRDTNCDKFHPHGLVHEYTAFLNKCGAISSEGSDKMNGDYKIIGANAMTLRPGMILTADHCNDNASATIVQHHPFSLMVGQFTDCCSFEHGGCGFKCIAFALNEVPPSFGGDGMDGGDVRIKVCRNEECDKVHPHGLVHEYTANLNKCEKVNEDDKKDTNGEYEIIGATAAMLAEGTILTAKQCGNTTGVVPHGDFSLIVGEFTDCCSFRHGGCGFKCITFKQAFGGPQDNGTAANGTEPDNSMVNATTTGAVGTTPGAAATTAAGTNAAAGTTAAAGATAAGTTAAGTTAAGTTAAGTTAAGTTPAETTNTTTPAFA